MKIVKGDLIKLAKEGHFNAIIHGCNCFHTMGAGIAAQIKKQFPLAYEADCLTEYGDKTKLGNYTFAKHGDLTIINAYTQYAFGSGMNVDYDAIDKAFERIAKNFSLYKIAYPKIGAGLGGGDWSIIEKIIEKRLDGLNHTMVVFY